MYIPIRTTTTEYSCAESRSTPALARSQMTSTQESPVIIMKTVRIACQGSSKLQRDSRPSKGSRPEKSWTPATAKMRMMRKTSRTSQAIFCSAVPITRTSARIERMCCSSFMILRARRARKLVEVPAEPVPSSAKEATMITASRRLKGSFTYARGPSPASFRHISTVKTTVKARLACSSRSLVAASMPSWSHASTAVLPRMQAMIAQAK
mmetsp:Transcript_31565/g.77029  ORF Transcript_31565/g.77029 Transcript_31565/m.77029 type:complete len:209 (+) Transcript_31565:364-990(+)